MKDIADFERKLAEIIGKPTTLRPFVCEGSPLDCEVFIIGFNPATEMSEDWWQFWRKDYGFAKDLWLKVYKKERASRPLEVGKTRRSAVSNTRRVIEWVLEASDPVRCLETNIYAAASKKASDLEIEKRTTEVVDFLIKYIEPKHIVTHGKKAGEYIQHIKNSSYDVFNEKHFRFLSKEAARKLGHKIKLSQTQ